MAKSNVIVLDYCNGSVVILKNVEYTESISEDSDDIVLKALEKIGYKAKISEISYMFSDDSFDIDTYDLENLD